MVASGPDTVVQKAESVEYGCLIVSIAINVVTINTDIIAGTAPGHSDGRAGTASSADTRYDGRADAIGVNTGRATDQADKQGVNQCSHYSL